MLKETRVTRVEVEEDFSLERVLLWILAHGPLTGSELSRTNLKGNLTKEQEKMKQTQNPTIAQMYMVIIFADVEKF